MGKRERKEKTFSDDGEGRKGRLDEQTLGYYRRVSDSLNEGFENEEDKDVMLTNIFNQLSTEALHVSINQTVSHIVQNLVQEASAAQLTQVMNAFNTDLETACTDRFASHVMQTMLTRAGQVLSTEVNMEEINFTEVTENPKTLRQMIENVHKFLLVNTAVHMQQTYTSHVLRTLLEVLSGTNVADSVIRSRLSRQQKKVIKEEKSPKSNVAEEFKPLLKSLLKKVLDMQKLGDLAENPLSNPVLQTVLLVSQSRSVKSCRKACEQLIESTNMFTVRQSDTPKDENSVLTTLPDLLAHEVGSHLIEQLILVAPNDLYESLLQNHFQPHLLTMSLHPIANFVLQQLIVGVRTKEQFELIYDNVCKNFEDILAHNRPHVIVNLAQGCLKFGTKQEKFVKTLMKTFHCYKPEERQSKVFPLIASLTTYDVFYKIPDEEDEKQESDDDEETTLILPVLTKINLHGTVLLQNLLKFGNPRLITISMLDMKGSSLRNLACDSHGSFVYNAIVDSNSIGEKTLENLVTKLKSQWVEIACNKSGSRVVDKLWLVASIKQKQTIAEELCKHEHRLQGDHFGRFVYRNCALHLFKTRRQAWLNAQKGANQKRKLFDDILGGGKKRKVVKNGEDRTAPEDSEDEDTTSKNDIETDQVHSTTPGKSQDKKALHKGQKVFTPETFKPSAKKHKRKHKIKKEVE